MEGFTHDQLSEELLETILLHVRPPPGLSVHSLEALQNIFDVSKVPKKFRRIAEPHLYSLVNIVMKSVWCYLVQRKGNAMGSESD